jgi:GDP/UDP-N,N'-diacetylbacillosamine 2-epimerase (hydrolysing)
MSTRKICAITGNRSEYGLLFPVLKAIKSHKKLSLQLIATTSHLSKAFGSTFTEIESDGFQIDEKIDNLIDLDTKTAIVKSTGILTMQLADTFEKITPDIVLLLGDRYEAHASAIAAILMNIPIAHIHGGEITEGAVDDLIRHSITKMSYLHFCSTEVYRQRIIQMGEDSQRVFNAGAPGIDNIANLELLSKKEIEKKIQWKFNKKSALFTYHSSTLINEDLNKDLDSIFKVLLESDISVLMTYANSDFGGRLINKKIEEFCKLKPSHFKVVKNLGQLKYLTVMKYVDLVIGNSSSGIIEAASFQKPVINIGLRQRGRLKGSNVIDCKVNDLANSIELALSTDFIIHCQSQKNIYGDGSAAKSIVRELAAQPLSIRKKFIDIK